MLFLMKHTVQWCINMRSRFLIDLRKIDVSEISTWLHHNTTGYYTRNIEFHPEDASPVSAEVFLENDTDAMMFKLKFSNYAIA